MHYLKLEIKLVINMIAKQSKTTDKRQNHGEIVKKDKRDYRRPVREPMTFKEQESTIPGVPILTCNNGAINPETEWNFISVSVERINV